MFPSVDKTILFEVLDDPTAVYTADELREMLSDDYVLRRLASVLGRRREGQPPAIFSDPRFWTAWLLRGTGRISRAAIRTFRMAVQHSRLRMLVEMVCDHWEVMTSSSRVALFLGRFAQERVGRLPAVILLEQSRPESVQRYAELCGQGERFLRPEF
jgi:hypothetical protein